MTDDAPPPRELSDLLGRVETLLREPLDFTQTDPESALRNVRLLAAVATYFNILALSDFGGRAGAERQPGLVEPVVAATFQTFAGIDPHRVRRPAGATSVPVAGSLAIADSVQLIVVAVHFPACQNGPRVSEDMEQPHVHVGQ